MLHYVSRLIQAMTVVESDQNVVGEIFCVKDDVTAAVSLVAIEAAINSRRGIVAFSGAMRDLALNRLIFISFSFSVLAKTAAAYAVPLASQNVCSVKSSLPNFRENSIRFNAGKSSNQSINLAVCLSVTFASQSIFSDHNSLSNNFGSTDVGHVKRDRIEDFMRRGQNRSFRDYLWLI